MQVLSFVTLNSILCLIIRYISFIRIWQATKQIICAKRWGHRGWCSFNARICCSHMHDHHIWKLTEMYSQTYVTSTNKKGLKSLGPIRATDKVVRKTWYVLHLTVILQLTWKCLSFKIQAWFNIPLNCILCTFWLCHYQNSDKIDFRPLSWEWLPYCLLNI